VYRNQSLYPAARQCLICQHLESSIFKMKVRRYLHLLPCQFQSTQGSYRSGDASRTTIPLLPLMSSRKNQIGGESTNSYMINTGKKINLIQSSYAVYVTHFNFLIASVEHLRRNLPYLESLPRNMASPYV